MKRPGPKKRLGPPPPPRAKVTLSCDQWLIDLAKSRGINLSKALTDTLRVQLEIEDDPRPRIRQLESELKALKDQLDRQTTDRWVMEDLTKHYLAFTKGTATTQGRFETWWDGVAYQYSSLRGRDPVELHGEILKKMEALHGRD